MQNFKNGNVPVADNKASSLIKLAEKELSSLYSGSELETINFWLLEHFAGIDRSNFIKNFNANVNQSSIIHFCNAIEKLKEGIPVQYVIGVVDFYDIKLNVNNSVLIPRPETEELVDLIVKENKNNRGLRILEIGTGSGCIALSLAKHLESSHITAIDVSSSALETAKVNTVNNSLANVEFLEMDFLKEKYILEGEFDMIVSNPPYIAQSERPNISTNVLDFEPELALFVPDDNALIFYEKIASMANKNLKRKGVIFVEINEQLGIETAALFTSDMFTSVEVIKDMSGKDRFIKAVR